MPEVHGTHAHHTQFQSLNPLDTTNTTAPSAKRAAVNASDSTSSASGTDSRRKGGNYDAGLPLLDGPVNSGDLLEIIGNAQDKSLRQIRQSQKDMQMQSQSAWVNTTVIVANPDVTQANSNSSNSNTPTTTPSNQSTPSSSSSSNSSTTTQNTIAEIRTQGGTLRTLESTLTDAVTDDLLKKLAKHRSLPSQVTDSIQAFIHQGLTSGMQFVLIPAVQLLGQQGLNTRTDNKTVNAATAVSFQEMVTQMTNSGTISSFVNSLTQSDAMQSYAAQEFPNSPAQQNGLLNSIKDIMNGSIPSTLLRASATLTGKSLDMPGYSNQLLLQAKVVRDENTSLSDSHQSASLSSGVATQFAAVSGLSQGDLTNKVSDAIHKTMVDPSTGQPLQYMTREDLVAALTTNLNTQFPDNPNLASQLANAIDESASTGAIGDQKAFPPPFNASDLATNPDQYNQFFGAYMSSLSTAIQQQFNESDKAVAVSRREDEIANQVLDKNILSTYRNAQDIRDATVSALVNSPDIDISRTHAEALAAQLNLGDSYKASPLYDASNTTSVLTPSNFAQSLADGYQSFVGVSPTSPLGDGIGFASGVTTQANEDSFLGTINSIWYSGNTETRSYLNPTASDAAKYDQLSLGDPAAAVKQWGIEGNNDPKHQKPIQSAFLIG